MGESLVCTDVDRWERACVQREHFIGPSLNRVGSWVLGSRPSHDDQALEFWSGLVRADSRPGPRRRSAKGHGGVKRRRCARIRWASPSFSSSVRRLRPSGARSYALADADLLAARPHKFPAGGRPSHPHGTARSHFIWSGAPLNIQKHPKYAASGGSERLQVRGRYRVRRRGYSPREEPRLAALATKPNRWISRELWRSPHVFGRTSGRRQVEW